MVSGGTPRWETGARRAVHHVLATLLIASTLVAGFPQAAHAASVPAGFTDQFVNSNLSNVVDIKFTPDGMALMAERHGGIVMVNPTISPAQKWNVFDIPTDKVFFDGEAGALSVAIDPQWETNRWFYVYYMREEDGSNSTGEARIERFTMFATGNPDQPWDALFSSGTVIWESGAPTSTEFHLGGDLVFDNAGQLYLSTGDNLTSGNSLNLNSYHGKIIRINKDGSIPADNPLVGQAGRDDIWAWGLRNPFGLDHDPATDRILAADVGGNNQNTAVEEVNDIVKGANYGWAGDGNCEGINGCPPGVTLPIIWYEHFGSGASVIGGSIIRGGFGPQYEGAYFYADFVRDWIKYATFDAQGNVTAQNISFATGVSNPIDLEQSPFDGALYYIQNGNQLRRIVSNNSQPVILSAGANPTSGPLPLNVQFSVAAQDPNNDPLTYNWDFGDGNGSTQEDPVHQYTAAGEYLASVEVSDGQVSVFSDPILIQAGVPPIVNLTVPPEDDPFVAGQEINYTISATDPDGNDALITYSMTVELGHNEHFHPGPLQDEPGAVGSFLIETEGHDFSDDVYFRLTATATDEDGLSTVVQRRIDPDEVDITLTTDPPGLPLLRDTTEVQTPFTIDTLIGSIHTVEAPAQGCLNGVTPYVFSHWSDGGDRVHQIVTPNVNTTYTAHYVPGGLCPQEIIITVSTGSDDAESEEPALTSADLDISQKTVGVRFPNVQIPTNAVVQSAFIQFTDDDNAAEPGSGNGSIPVNGVADSNPGTFTSAGDVAGRQLSSSTISWDLTSWPNDDSTGPGQRTPDLKSIVEETIGLPGWAPGNAMAFIFGETNGLWRVAESFEGNPAEAPVLYIAYVVDAIPPVITLNGDNPLSWPLGVPFVDNDGATVTDNVDPTTTVFGTGFVDVNTPGTYVLTYEATDSAGNVATPVTRDVQVGPPPAPGFSIGIDAADGVTVPGGIGGLTGDLTLETWINWDGVGSRSLLGPSYLGEGELVVWPGGQLAFYHGNGGTWEGFFSSRLLQPGVWTHVVVTRDSSGVSFFVDGVLTDTDPVGLVPAASGADFDIGLGTLTGLSGGLDEVAVYDSALAAADVEQHFGLLTIGDGAGYAAAVAADSPVGYWRLEESGGSVASDETGSHDGTYVGSPTFEQPGALGVVPAPASVFFNRDAAVGVPNAPALQITGDLTMEGWVWWDDEDTSVGRSLFGKSYLGEGQVVAWPTGQLGFYHGNGVDFQGFISSVLLAPGEWTHVAVTRGAGVVSWYVNGVLANTIPVGLAPTASASDFRLGWRPLALWDGGLDEVAVYDRALSGAELAEHVGLIANPGAYQATVVADGPVAYWQLDEPVGRSAGDTMNAHPGVYLGTPQYQQPPAG